MQGAIARQPCPPSTSSTNQPSRQPPQNSHSSIRRWAVQAQARPWHDGNGAGGGGDERGGDEWSGADSPQPSSKDNGSSRGSAGVLHPLFPQQQQSGRGPILVRTQRGLPSFRVPIPEDPCPACGGTGKCTCGNCRGKGRLNYRDAPMLPHGVWPAWCPACRASGRWHCPRCMGTGVRRSTMGFRLPHQGEEEQ